MLVHVNFLDVIPVVLLLKEQRQNHLIFLVVYEGKKLVKRRVCALSIETFLKLQICHVKQLYRGSRFG